MDRVRRSGRRSRVKLCSLRNPTEALRGIPGHHRLLWQLWTVAYVTPLMGATLAATRVPPIAVIFKLRMAAAMEIKHAAPAWVAAPSCSWAARAEQQAGCRSRVQRRPLDRSQCRRQARNLCSFETVAPCKNQVHARASPVQAPRRANLAATTRRGRTGAWMRNP